MSFDFHASSALKFEHQYLNAQKYVIPFIESGGCSVNLHTNVMEIGCGEGGVLKAFTDRGAKCLGVDLSESRVNAGKKMMKAEMEKGLLNLMAKNVYDADFLETYQHAFDLIILKDTIEHIPEQEKFIPYLKKFLKPNGHIFFGFPPWCMPFGGHQQVCKSKIASKLPYYHLLPMGIFTRLLRFWGENEITVESLVEVKETGISTWRFENILKNSQFRTAKRTLYIINPIYEYKFGLKPRKQLGIIAAIPGLRDFVSMCGYYLVLAD